MTTRRTFIAGMTAATLAKPALAQGKYPDRPIKIAVPFGPGGLADVTIRVVGDKLAQRLGQQIIVVNQPGAGGATAARSVLSSPADGYNLLLVTNGTAVSAAFLKNLGFDPVNDFMPVSALGFFDFTVVTSAEHPYKTLADLIAAMKAKPGALNAGTINLGSTQHLSAVLMKSLAKTDFAIVPFRTTPEAITGLLRKDVDFIIDGYSATSALLKDGKLRALATSGPTRSASLPDVPTVIESGLAGFDVTSWNAVFAPKGTPPEMVKVLNEGIRAALADADVKKRLADLGIEAKASSEAEIGDRLKADITRWAAVIQQAGIERQ